MISYAVDYEYGGATFITEERDTDAALREFAKCGRGCFGLRKSMGRLSAVKVSTCAVLPPEYRDLGGTHYLAHSGDEVLFDLRHACPNGDPWKLVNEWGNACTCAERGKPELACEVHHFWVADHDTVCPSCQTERDEA